MLISTSCAQEEEIDPFLGMSARVSLSQVGWLSNDRPIQMKASSDIDTSTIITIEEEMSKWEESCDFDFFENLGSTNPLQFSNLKDYYLEDKDTNGIYFTDNDFEDIDNNFLAITQLFLKKNDTSESRFKYKIVHADIIINRKNYSFTDDVYDISAFYLPRIIIHELGHVLGLGHEASGIMKGSIDKSNRNSALTENDIELIKNKYNSLDNQSNLKTVEPAEGELLRVVIATSDFSK
jgi:hypothetical protein